MAVTNEDLQAIYTTYAQNTKFGKTVPDSLIKENFPNITVSEWNAIMGVLNNVYDSETTFANSVSIALQALNTDKVDKTTTVNGHALSTNVTVTKADVGLGNVVNTGDSAIPVSGGTTKFTTGGAYTELNRLENKLDARVPQFENDPLELVQLDDEGKTYEPSGVVVSDLVPKTREVNGHALSSNVTVTASDVGLGNVVNTGDSDTPVSGGATKFTTGGAYTELAKKADKVSGSNLADRIATLDSNGNLTNSGKLIANTAGNVPVLNENGKLSNTVIPPLAIGDLIASNCEKDDLVTFSNAMRGDIAVVGPADDDVLKQGVYWLADDDYSDINNWVQIVGPGRVISVNEQTGFVTITKSTIGLGNVNNTSDLNKPISTATQTALDAKSNATNLKNATGTGSLKQVDTNDYNAATGVQSIALGASSIACPNPSASDSAIIADWEIREDDKYQLAKGQHAFASGSNNLALGKNSHAEGNGTVASGSAAHSEGTGGKATGKYSHVGGREGTATQECAFSHGLHTTASGKYSVALGHYAEASAETSVALGAYATASGAQSFAEGLSTHSTGNQTHAEGYNTTASGNQAHAEGQGTIASASQTHAEGYNTTASGEESHAEGSTTIASGKDAHAEGYKTRASGDFSHAGGWGDDTDDANQPYKKYVEATGNKSFAHGSKCKATGTSAIAMGDCAEATANYAVAFGNEAEATGVAAAAIGDHTVASGERSAAVGPNSVAQHTRATAFGYGLQTNDAGQAVYGKWNASSSDPIVFGNGSSSSARRNILTLSENNDDGTVFGTRYIGDEKKVKFVDRIHLRYDSHGGAYLTSDAEDPFYIKATEKYGKVIIESTEYGGVELHGGYDGYIGVYGDGSSLFMNANVSISTPYGGVYVNGQCISYGGCIVEGTMITMADGTKKAIEDVHTGDEVLSYDFEHETNVPAVVLFNDEHQRAVGYRQNLFSDGSVLNTYDEHYVYNVNGSACSDIRLWETKDAVQKQDGTVANWCGWIQGVDVAIRTFNLITSNNTYYANEILNSCWPSTKYRLAKLRGAEMPDALYDAVKQELGYHRNGSHKANDAAFLAAVKDVEAQCTLTAKTIAVNKKKLENTDYQMVKTCELVNQAIMDAKDFDDLKKRVSDIYSQEFTAKVNTRQAAREAIKAVEDQSAALYEQVKEIKRQYGVWGEFEDMTTREQFMLCNKLGCENLDKYRNWDYIVTGRQLFNKVKTPENPTEEK